MEAITVCGKADISTRGSGGRSFQRLLTAFCGERELLDVGATDDRHQEEKVELRGILALASAEELLP